MIYALPITNKYYLYFNYSKAQFSEGISLMMKLLAIFCLLSIIQNTWSMEVTEESLEEAFGVLNECFQYFDFSYDTDSFRCMDKASEEKHVNC